jgi:hypothetical protein
MVPGLDDFLRDQPKMSIRPGRKPELVIEGTFSFIAEAAGRETIEDQYDLQLEIPERFPKSLPRVTEYGYKIPRENPAFHINPDATLCLGTELRLLLQLSRKPSLVGFSDNCLVPYLYAISTKLRHGGKLVFSELDHGSKGELSDYADLFGLDSPEAAGRTLQLIRVSKRIANKQPCPCGCKQRLGKCDFNRKVRRYRELLKVANL